MNLVVSLDHLPIRMLFLAKLGAVVLVVNSVAEVVRLGRFVGVILVMVIVMMVMMMVVFMNVMVRDSHDCHSTEQGCQNN